MIFYSPKSAALKFFSMLILLASCAQPPHFVPVKTVNQRLKPNNGYVPEKLPIKSNDKPDNSQRIVKIPDKRQEINLNQQKLFSIRTHPRSDRHKPSKAFSVDQAKKATKNKLADFASEKSKPSNPQNFVTSGCQLIDKPNNISILSKANKGVAQNNQHNDVLAVDSLKLTKKNNKKSSISIDNKKVLKLNFQWPLLGRVSRDFSQTENKGIFITGKKGQSVHASEAGKAVYCGRGLPSFGNLAIIKHNEIYLSAYANNSKLTIKEGQQLEKGQTIGQVGLTGLKNSSLHFEIRKNGKPINPLTMLPKR